MSTKFGLHVTQGSRNGYGPVCEAAPAVVLAVGEGGALVEAREKSGGRTITIFREQTVYHDAPPGIDQMSEVQARQAAEQYWPQLVDRYRLNPADYYQAVNETGGDNPTSLRNIVAFEMRLMELAEADGYRLCVGNPAGGSPGSWELWLQFYVPLIRRAGQGGHIYGRHAYGGVVAGSSGMLTKSDGTPADENAGRPFREAVYLREQGILTPMVVTEAGQNGGYQFPGVDDFLADVARYDALCRQHSNIWGFCTWTYGNYQDFPANIESASEAIRAYLQQQGGATRPVYPSPAIDDKPGEIPVDDLHKWLWEESKKRRRITVHHKHGLEAIVWEQYPGYQLLHNEEYAVHPDGSTYGLMGITHTVGIGPDVVLAFEAPWAGPGWVLHLTEPSTVLFSSPVGTVEERASGKIWPGDWVDATGFGTRYQITSGGSYHRHTGADLNLNKPTWNADKGMPVHAAGAGVVTYARHVPAPSTWGRLVVIRHTLPDGKVLHTRYAHMGSMLVQEGQQVLRGDVLGTINAAGLAVGQDHLHFDVSHSGILENDPRHWPYDSLASVAANYLNPKLFLEGKADALVEPAQLGPAGTTGLVGSLPYNVNSPWPFAPPREPGAIKTIVIHHSDGPSNQSALAVADYHTRTKNWPEIGYHYWIAGDGRISRTNLPETISYHASSANGTSLGVCLAGSFMDGAQPTAAQIASTRTLVNWLRARLPGIEVKPHLAVVPTDCPGNTWTTWWEAATGEGAPPPPTAPTTIDLLPYIRGDGRAYMVRHPSGAQEKFRSEQDGAWFYLVKNNQFEQFRADSQYIWRGLDSSPGPAPDYAERPGALRFYSQMEPGQDAARWCPRHMAVGATWAGPGHTVQFCYKDDCRPSAANSGPATNRTRLVAHHASKTWNGITVPDVVELDGGPGSAERFFYARDWGLVAWEASWGSSAVSEVGVAGDNARESLPC